MPDLNWFEKVWMNMWPHRGHVRWHVPRFLRAAPEPIRGEVLEVGAGQGWTSRRILETFPQVELTAIDVDETALRKIENMRKQYGNRLATQVASVTDLPFDRGKFEIVLAINVLRQLPEQELAQAISEVLRVLRPAGLLGISDYAAWDPTRGVSAKTLENILAQQGLEVVYSSAGRGHDVWAKKIS